MAAEHSARFCVRLFRSLACEAVRDRFVFEKRVKETRESRLVSLGILLTGGKRITERCTEFENRKNRKKKKKGHQLPKRRGPSVFAIYWRPRHCRETHSQRTWQPQVRANRLERLTTWRTGRTSRRRKNYCSDDAAASAEGVELP